MTKDQQLKQKIAEIIIKHLGVCDKESPEEILRLFEEEVLQIKKKETIKERLITLGIGTIAIIIVLGFIILVNFYLYNKTIYLYNKTI